MFHVELEKVQALLTNSNLQIKRAVQFLFIIKLKAIMQTCAENAGKRISDSSTIKLKKA